MQLDEGDIRKFVNEPNGGLLVLPDTTTGLIAG
jgi:hypothetical protein